MMNSSRSKTLPCIHISFSNSLFLITSQHDMIFAYIRYHVLRGIHIYSTIFALPIALSI